MGRRRKEKRKAEEAERERTRQDMALALDTLGARLKVIRQLLAEVEEDVEEQRLELVPEARMKEKKKR